MIGGVPLTAAAYPNPMPKEPNPRNMDVVWPTNRLQMNVPIQMSDGSEWTVKKIKTNRDGSCEVSLGATARSRATDQRGGMALTVPAEYLGTQIWWVGRPPRVSDDPVEETNPETVVMVPRSPEPPKPIGTGEPPTRPPVEEPPLPEDRLPRILSLIDARLLHLLGLLR